MVLVNMVLCKINGTSWCTSFPSGLHIWWPPPLGPANNCHRNIQHHYRILQVFLISALIWIHSLDWWRWNSLCLQMNYELQYMLMSWYCCCWPRKASLQLCVNSVWWRTSTGGHFVLLCDHTGCARLGLTLSQLCWREILNAAAIKDKSHVRWQ